jgi:hypothetical protein
LAPTAIKEYNGVAERRVQTLKQIRQCVISHLTPAHEDYFKKSIFLSTAICNRSPHNGIKKKTIPVVPNKPRKITRLLLAMYRVMSIQLYTE